MTDPELTSNPQGSFERLRTEIQAELLENNGIFSLVQEALGFQDTEAELPDFKLSINYPTLSEANAAQLDGEPREYIGQGLIIERGAQSNLGDEPRLNIGFSTYTYLKLGYMRHGEVSISLFDDAGRLHEFFPKDGNVGIKRGQIEERRVDAIQAWARAHNKMIRAARENPAMHIDEMTHAWTDETESYRSMAE